MRASRQVLLPIVRKVVISLLLTMAIIAAVTHSGSAHFHASSHSQHSIPNAIDSNRPVLAFYYTWHRKSDWCSCHMSDLPTIRYNSADDRTIDRQLNWAANAGISGFISSWWGIGDQTDRNFAKQKIWAAGVMPGYDDTRVRRKNPFKVPRNNGSTYRTSWDAAIASSPDWITITSFNEWYEGSMIEPSKTYNMQYLNITQQYTHQWHGK